MISLNSADLHDARLVAQVHPPAWVNPKPLPRYNLVVIGGGTAGLVAAAGAAGLGAKVALIERHLLGGDCLNYGCVPSKALLRAAKAVAQVRHAAAFGIHVPEGVHVDFPAIMERVRRLRADLSPHDSAERFRHLGVDVFLGAGAFSSPTSIDVAGQTLHFRKALIATGTRSASVNIPGLDEVGYLTNESIFSLTQLPPRLAILGAGPIGCELAQAFARLGSQVTLLQRGQQILPREDAAAAQVVEQALRRDGVQIHLQASLQSVEVTPQGKLLRCQGEPGDIHVDQLLLAAGRQPNIEGLNLEAAGVHADPQASILVNDFLQTSNRRIYAAGDVCSSYRFTHAADAMARLVLRNALFWGRAKVSALTIPWCTYTDPELARVGLSEREAQERKIPYDVFIQELSDVDRAVLDGATKGFVQVLVQHGSDRILGATVVAPDAGNLIAELTMAMTQKIGLGAIASIIHSYPTQAEAIKKLGDAYNRTRLTPTVKYFFCKWLSWSL